MEKTEYVTNTMEMVKNYLGNASGLDNVANTITELINSEYEPALNINGGMPGEKESAYDSLVNFYNELSNGINLLKEKNIEISQEM